MKKFYIKPIIEIIITDNSLLLKNSFFNSLKQCDCETYRRYGGCIGCTGNCGCNVWDSEEGRLIPEC